jgi:hypothetical protein
VALSACGSDGATSRCGVIESQQALSQGDTVVSCNGQFSLDLQTDGNLVLYSGAANAANALWDTATDAGDGRTPGYRAIMQEDGNFVLYDAHGTADANRLWSSDTSGHPGAYVDVQDDGNLVIYVGIASPSNALWATGTERQTNGGGSKCKGSGSSCSSSIECCSVCNMDPNSSWYHECE